MGWDSGHPSYACLRLLDASISTGYLHTIRGLFLFEDFIVSDVWSREHLPDFVTIGCHRGSTIAITMTDETEHHPVSKDFSFYQGTKKRCRLLLPMFHAPAFGLLGNPTPHLTRILKAPRSCGHPLRAGLWGKHIIPSFKDLTCVPVVNN